MKGEECIYGVVTRHIVAYIQFLVADAASLGYNQFFIGSPSGVNYFLPGCPNFKTGQTSESQNGQCPRVDIEDGTFKFTVLGLLTGSMVNSLNTAYPPASGAIDGSENVQRDIANYTKLLYRSTLDLGAMGGVLGNYTTEVVGGGESCFAARSEGQSMRSDSAA